MDIKDFHKNAMKRIKAQEYDEGLNNRAREIVRLASERTEDSEIKTWLLYDEQGTWEQTALEWLEKSKGQAEERGLGEQEVNEGIADYIAYLALEAGMKNRLKSQ